MKFNIGAVRKKTTMNLVIYGAQATALGAYEAIQKLHPVRKILCFLVTERGNNGEFLAGLPILELEDFSSSLSRKDKENTQILIATPENVMEAIEERLEAYGLSCHVRLTSRRWAELMSYHYICDTEFMPLSAFPIGFHRASIHLFMAKFYKDKPLNGEYHMPEWVTSIQVGAALCKERVANILDCDGKHISQKNGNYSELTALYWIWKNQLLSESNNKESEYYGLVHYRRILELSEDDVLRLMDNGVDAVLPFPMPYEPNIEVHHKRYLKKEDWDAVLKAISEVHPDYIDLFTSVLQQKYLYNYNIMLARKSVLADYCEWLFPILERVEDLSIPKGIDRNDRYIGYVGETLATLYFMANRNRLNIVHAGCRFLT